MPVVVNHESAMGLELEKWEQHRTKYVSDDRAPGNPYTYRPFPQMLYKAKPWVREQGTVRCQAPVPVSYGWPTPDAYNQAEMETARFNKENLLTVRNEAELAEARKQGWRGSPLEAEQYYEALQQDIAQAAAEANFGVRRMSEQAQAEYAAAGDSTHEHVVDLVGVPKATRGRPPGARVVTGTGVQE